MSPTAHGEQPTCFGYRIASELPLRFTRRGGGSDELQVAEGDGRRRLCRQRPVFEIHSDGRGVTAALYGVDGQFEFDVDGAGTYRVDTIARRIEVPPHGDPVRREQVLWGIPAMLCFVARGDLSLHAAAVAVDGGGLLLAAPGHHGKTTLALGFHDAGHRILTEDSACIEFGGGAPQLVPGPAIVRPRNGTQPPGVLRAAERSGRLELELVGDARAGGQPAPVLGVAFLREGAAGEPVELRPYAAADAIRDLWSLNFALPGTASRARGFEQIADLVQAVPCWNLHRPLTFDSIPGTVELLAGAVA